MATAAGELARAYLAIYRAQIGVALGVQLQHRGHVALWLLYEAVLPLVQLGVWTAVATSRGGLVGDFAAGDLAAYFVATLLVDQLTSSWVIYELEHRVRHGSLSARLLRPIHPIHADVASALSGKLLRLPALAPATALLAVAFEVTLDRFPERLLVGLPAIGLALALRFVLGWTLGLAAFWLTRVAAVNQLYFLAQWFLSGQLAPLALLPAPVQAVGAVLPFRWMVAFPVEVLLGRVRPHDLVVGLAAQALWLVAGLLLLRAVWRAGLRRYAAVGA